MPVSVPTTDEFIGLYEQVVALEARVTALEQAEPQPPEPEPPAGTLSATVYLGGASFVFSEAAATDIGSYTPPSGKFTLSCRRQTLEGCPLRLDFRRIDGWSSVVFELGDILGAATDLTSGYSVEIVDDAGTPHVIEIASHWYLCRWRWQSGPWPHLRTPAEMFAARELPAFDAAWAIGAPVPAPAVYQPLGFAGFTPRMPNTGGRGDIGQVTELQGYALCTDRPEAWANVMAQGEAMNSWPWIMRDASTGAPLDIVNGYPMASFYADGRTNPLLYGSAGAKAAGVEADVAHQPAGAWLPWLRSEDPYFLEVLQCQNLFNFCEVPRDAVQMPGYGQVRAQAWSVRTLVQGWLATPEIVPSWLLPKSVMRNLLDQTLTQLTWSVSRQDALRLVFHVPDWFLNYAGNTPTGTCVAVWQDDFCLGAWAWAAVLEPGFIPAATFITRNALDRLGGCSGWPPAVPEVYSLQVCDVPDAPVYTSWQKAWEVNAPQLGLDPANPPQQLRYTSAAEFDYPNGFLAGLAMIEQARALGVALPDCSAILKKLSDAMAEGARTVPGGSIYWRSSIAH